MIANRSMPTSTVIPVLGYPDVGEAAAWLCEAFGFTERLRIGDHRVQLIVGSGAVVVTGLGAARPAASEDAGGTAEALRAAGHSVMVRIDDVHGHHERAMGRGARILQAPADFPYGERQYTVQDPGGHVWTFSQSIADVAPADWGGRLVE